MPIYEYRCATCAKEFERLGSLRDQDSDVECPICNAVGAEKLMSRCKSKVEMSFSDFQSMGAGAPGSGGSGCSGCSATSCSTCK